MSELDPGAALAAWLRFEAASGVTQWQADAPTPWVGADHHTASASDAGLTDNAGRDAGAPPVVSARQPSVDTAFTKARAGDVQDQAPHVDPSDAKRLAASCGTLDQLIEALKGFTGCGLAKTARNLCFGDGDPSSKLMLIGEAPGAEEDRQGKPFVGPSGQLLDRMLAAAGRPRDTVWITNAVFWRPPGNRAPTTQEMAICQPFLERQIELLQPHLLLFVGGTAAKSMLGLKDGVTRLRGRRYDFAGAGRPVPATIMFHPAYLLRQPQHKGLAWRDLLFALDLVSAADAENGSD